MTMAEDKEQPTEIAPASQSPADQLCEAHRAELTTLNEAKETAEAAEADAFATLKATDEYVAHAETRARARHARDASQLYIAFLCKCYDINPETDGLLLDGTIRRGIKQADNDLVPASSVSRARLARAQRRAQQRNQTGGSQS